MTTIAFLLFPGLTQLDMTGPAQFLSRMPGAKVNFVWANTAPVMTDAGFAIVPTATFTQTPHADILCVPGGIGVGDVMADDAALDWVRGVGQQATWVTSVCTGSLILGAAGLLRGYQATTHWAWHHLLDDFGAHPVHARTVTDRNRITGGGVTAGIDFALTLIAAVQGEAVAKTLQLAFEYDPAPPFAGGSPETSDPAIVDAYRAMIADRMATREAQIKEQAVRLGFS